MASCTGPSWKIKWGVYSMKWRAMPNPTKNSNEEYILWNDELYQTQPANSNEEYIVWKGKLYRNDLKTKMRSIYFNWSSRDNLWYLSTLVYSVVPQTMANNQQAQSGVPCPAEPAASIRYLIQLSPVVSSLITRVDDHPFGDGVFCVLNLNLKNCYPEIHKNCWNSWMASWMAADYKSNSSLYTSTIPLW